MSKRLEKEIEQETMAVLRRNGWTVEKNHQTMLNRGRPDLHAAHPVLGEWWIEMKRPGGKLGPHQWKWMLRWHGVVNVVVCDDETKVLEIIRDWTSFRDDQDLRAGPTTQWVPWMTGAQTREVATGTTPLDDAMSDWAG